MRHNADTNLMVLVLSILNTKSIMTMKLAGKAVEIPCMKGHENNGYEKNKRIPLYTG